MGNVIPFDKDKGREGLATIEAAKLGNTDLLNLSTTIAAAQQSVKSMALLQGGYCGSGLKREIASANALSEHLKNAGLLAQAMISTACQ